MAFANKIAMYALTRNGAELARRLQNFRLEAPRIMAPEEGERSHSLPEAGGQGQCSPEEGCTRPDIFLPLELAEEFGAHGFSGLSPLLRHNFAAYSGHVFITAAGIAVRAITPLLRDKHRDPAVVVLDQAGEHAVSLLSGHTGGGNALARQIARVLGGRAVITTATDCLGLPSVDELAASRDLVPANPEAITRVNAALANSRPLQLYDPRKRLGLEESLPGGFPLHPIQDQQELDPGRATVWVDWRLPPETISRSALVLHPRCLVAGVGCNRNTHSREILELIHLVFQEYGLALQSLSCLATSEAKADEAGLHKSAQALQVPLVTTDSDSLKRIPAPHPSATVHKHMGVASVCEAAALHHSRAGRLMISKRKSRNATLAIALAG